MERYGYADPMAFLEHLPRTDRERLMTVGDVRHLEEGEYLLRRGSQSGDLFCVESGRLEVLDARQSPEVVLDVLSAGRVVGEMSFVDQSPRAADVRALEPSSVHHWPSEDLQRLISSDQGLNARFYRALSLSTVERLRSTDHLALTLQEGAAQTAVRQQTAAAEEEARAVASVPRSVWTSAEESVGGAALRDVEHSVEALAHEMNSWLSNISSLTVARNAGRVLRTELRPTLAKSMTGQLGMERRTAENSRSRFFAHLLLNAPSGTDEVGERLDAGLLGLPSAEGLRARTALAVDAIRDLLPEKRPVRITLLQPNCGAMLARLLPHLALQGAALTVVDGDSTALAFVDAGLRARPAEVQLHLVHADLSGLKPIDFGSEMDVVVVDGLLEHLPSRQVGAVLGMLRRSLAPGGQLVVTAMAPSIDARLMEHLLDWPLMRRTSDEWVDLLVAGGFIVERVSDPRQKDHCGLVFTASRSDASQD